MGISLNFENWTEVELDKCFCVSVISSESRNQLTSLVRTQLADVLIYENPSQLPIMLRIFSCCLLDAAECCVARDLTAQHDRC